MTVRELLSRIDSRELSEWQVVYGLSPWGPERADLRAGTIAAVVANVGTSGDFRPSDFMPTYTTPEPQSDEQLRLMAMKSNAMLGGTVR